MLPTPSNTTASRFQRRLLRRKTGCLVCRRRKKKCDERQPSCTGCERNYLICVWPKETAGETTSNLASHDESVNHIVHGSSADGDDDESMTAGDGVVANAVLAQLPAHSRLLLEHYFHRTARIMSPCRSGNPFITKLMPWAMSNDLVLHCLLVLSGLHYADEMSLAVDSVTWTHYSQILRGLKYGLTRHTKGEDSGLAALLIATLLLSFIETATTHEHQNGVPHHIHGSRLLIFSALKLPESELDDEARSFLVELYLYMIVVSNISLGEESDLWVLEDATQLCPFIRTSNGLNTMCGSALDLFQIIPNVSLLVRRRQAEHAERISPSWRTLSSFLSLRESIQAWKPKQCEPTSAIVGKIYQQALSVYLESSFNRQAEGDCAFALLVDEYSPSVGKAFDIFVELLESLPEDSSASTTLCWPLAVFGSCARTRYHQNIVRQRLVALQKYLCLRTPRETLRLLEIMWAREGIVSRDPLSLICLMKESGTEIYFV